MQFYRQHVSGGQQKLTKLLLHDLKEGKSLLWLVAGGSNIKTVVAAMNDLSGYESNLTISLTDERYGSVGHADSNWQQLLDAGLKPGLAKLHPVLQPDLDLKATAEQFDQWLKEAFRIADVVIGQLGIGADGHTAGILPHSKAAEPTQALAVSYQTDEYSRVTTTFTALKRLDVAFCFAYGADKKNALQKLRNNELPLNEQPAQILKALKQAYVYNDQVGE